MIYILLLCIIILTGFLVNKNVAIDVGIRKINGSFVYFFLVGFLLIAVCGLRGLSVGIDTHMYVLSYITDAVGQNWEQYWRDYSYIEYGFYLYQFIMSRFFPYQFFLIVTAVISILPVVYVIYKYSKNRVMSFFLYVCFPYYTFCLTGIRQAMAIGIIMLAFIQFKKRNWKGYIVFCLLAALFHMSAILFLPVYWLHKIKYNKQVIIISVFAMISSYIFKDQIWSVVKFMGRQIYETKYAGGEKMYLFMILTVILGFVYRKRFKLEDEDNNVLLYMQILATVIWPIASANPGLARMYYYYHIFFILYVPEIICAITGKIEKSVVSGGYYGVALYFLFTQILTEEAHFAPYAFFWE